MQTKNQINQIMMSLLMVSITTFITQAQTTQTIRGRVADEVSTAHLFKQKYLHSIHKGYKIAIGAALLPISRNIRNEVMSRIVHNNLLRNRLKD